MFSKDLTYDRHLIRAVAFLLFARIIQASTFTESTRKLQIRLGAMELSKISEADPRQQSSYSPASIDEEDGMFSSPLIAPTGDREEASNAMAPGSIQLPHSMNGQQYGMMIRYCKKLLILCTGGFLGVILFFPYGMMTDSGTRVAIIVANIGIITCILFCIGGCVGFVTGNWSALLPAACCQALMFAIMIFSMAW